MSEKEQDINFRSLFVPITTKKAIILIIIIGFIVFFSTLFNGFVADDHNQIQYNPSIQSIFNIPKLFISSTFEDVSNGQRGNYYKPILTTTFSLIYFVSNENVFGYHLFQILIHIFNTILIFLIFNTFFRKKISLLASLIFLIHPINVEAVVYVSALQENLFMVFGLLALYVLIKSRSSFKKNMLIFTLLLCSILSKETGFLFLLILPLFHLLFRKEKSGDKLKILLIIDSLIAIIYLYFRIGLAHINFTSIKIAPIQTLPFTQRIINIPAIVIFYFKTFLFPKDLIMFQTWYIQNLDLNNFYLPLIIIGIILLLLLAIAIMLYRNKQHYFKIYLFFLTWLIIGLGIHLQLIPLDETVSDRWFYFPIIGVLGILAVLAENINIKSYQIKTMLMILYIILLFTFGIRDIVRIGNWQNEKILTFHDIKNNPNSSQLQKGVADIYLSEGNIKLAELNYDKTTKTFPGATSFYDQGTFYLSIHNPKQAEKSFSESLTYDPTYSYTWFGLSLSKYFLNDKEGALMAATKAYSISPTPTFQRMIEIINNGESIKY